VSNQLIKLVSVMCIFVGILFNDTGILLASSSAGAISKNLPINSALSPHLNLNVKNKIAIKNPEMTQLPSKKSIPVMTKFKLAQNNSSDVGYSTSNSGSIESENGGSPQNSNNGSNIDKNSAAGNIEPRNQSESNGGSVRSNVSNTSGEGVNASSSQVSSPKNGVSNNSSEETEEIKVNSVNHSVESSLKKVKRRTDGILKVAESSGETRESAPGTPTADNHPMSHLEVSRSKAKDSNGKSESNTGQKWKSSGTVNAATVDITQGVRILDIVQPTADYHFSTFGRGDPFKPQFNLSDDRPRAQSIGVPLVSVLQKFDLSELKVVGVWISADGQGKAMISSPGGQGVVVKLDDPIGKKGGKLLEIREDNIVIREFTVAFDGTRQFEDKNLWISGRKPIEKEILTIGSGVSGAGDASNERDLSREISRSSAASQGGQIGSIAEGITPVPVAGGSGFSGNGGISEGNAPLSPNAPIPNPRQQLIHDYRQSGETNPSLPTPLQQTTKAPKL